MKILVTGGTGFIGSFVVEELIRKGHLVSIIAHGRQLPTYLTHISDKINYFQGDFGEPDILDKALEGCEAVIHLAWATVPKQTKGATAFEFASNFNSSIALIEKSIDFNIKKFLFISSGGTVYGIPETVPISEMHPLNPISNYGLSKLTTEKLLHLYNYSNGLQYATLRVANAYGERQNFFKNQGVIGVWLKTILEDKPIEIWGDGSVVRDYVYVQDVAKAFANALESAAPAATYNIGGGGAGCSLNEILEQIRSVVDRPFEVVYKPARSFDVPVNVLDCTKAFNEIGYQPSIGLNDGIKRTWEWIKANYR